MENGLASLATARSELRDRITFLEVRRLVILLEPIDGKLAKLDVIAGTRVRPQQLIATIVPERSPLAADVYVPSGAFGLIGEVQVVRLIF